MQLHRHMHTHAHKKIVHTIVCSLRSYHGNKGFGRGCSLLRDDLMVFCPSVPHLHLAYLDNTHKLVVFVWLFGSKIC